MTVLQPYPFISFSPGLEVFCSCHNSGLIEIKCPASLISKVPAVENYHHLKLSDGPAKLKRNSEYYFQILVKMPVTDRMYCDFFYIFICWKCNISIRF